MTLLPKRNDSKTTQSSLFQKRIEYIGHILMPGQLAAAFMNLDAIKIAVFPTKSTRVRSLLGKCNVYRRFNNDLPEIARPLNDYLRKDIEWIGRTQRLRLHTQIHVIIEIVKVFCVGPSATAQTMHD